MSTEPRIIAVLTRVIPVEFGQVDTLTRLCEPGEPVADIVAWANRHVGENCGWVRLEITKEQP